MKLTGKLQFSLMCHGFYFSLSPNSVYTRAELLNVYNFFRPINPSVSSAKTFLVLIETKLYILGVSSVITSILAKNHIHVISQLNRDVHMHETAKNIFYRLLPKLAS